MKTQAKYLIAKYIPDLRRMEPRNIGIVLWSRGRSLCKFLSQSDANNFVNDPETYSRWITFWTTQVEQGEVHLARGEKIPVGSDTFLDFLKSTQLENYVLDDGGDLLEKLPVRQAATALEFLFRELVAASSSEPTFAHERRTLESGAEKVLALSGLLDRDDYTPRKEVTCDFQGIEVPLKFDHYFGNGRPNVVMQNVRLSRLQNVNSANWMFERVKYSYDGVRTGAIINTNEFDADSPLFSPLLSILQKLATVIDVAKEPLAVKTAKTLVG